MFAFCIVCCYQIVKKSINFGVFAFAVLYGNTTQLKNCIINCVYRFFPFLLPVFCLLMRKLAPFLLVHSIRLGPGLSLSIVDCYNIIKGPVYSFVKTKLHYERSLAVFIDIFMCLRNVFGSINESLFCAFCTFHIQT